LDPVKARAYIMRPLKVLNERLLMSRLSRESDLMVMDSGTRPDRG